jgi:hypothetical protein
MKLRVFCAVRTPSCSRRPYAQYAAITSTGIPHTQTQLVQTKSKPIRPKNRVHLCHHLVNHSPTPRWRHADAIGKQELLLL